MRGEVDTRGPRRGVAGEGVHALGTLRQDFFWERLVYRPCLVYRQIALAWRSGYTPGAPGARILPGVYPLLGPWVYTRILAQNYFCWEAMNFSSGEGSPGIIRIPGVRDPGGGAYTPPPQLLVNSWDSVVVEVVVNTLVKSYGFDHHHHHRTLGLRICRIRCVTACAVLYVKHQSKCTTSCRPRIWSDSSQECDAPQGANTCA